MGRRKGVSVRQRRVSTELRAWRIKRGLSCKDVANALGWSESKVSRMETGERGLYEDDVSAVLGFLRVPAEIRQELMDLVRAGNERNWHEIGGQLPISKILRDLIRFENEATAIYGFEPLLIPGLVQTAEYARALMRAFPQKISEEIIEGMVAARMDRRRVLDRADPPHLHLIIEEMALHRTMGDPMMMHGQLHHLLAATARRNVSIRILPFDAVGPEAAQGSLKIIDCPEQPTLCYEESRSTSAFLEDEEYIATARLSWKRLSSAAWSEEDSRQQIAEVASKLRRAT
jgi:transcriptional regulator with XRE-family HTH domain